MALSLAERLSCFRFCPALHEFTSLKQEPTFFVLAGKLAGKLAGWLASKLMAAAPAGW